MNFDWDYLSRARLSPLRLLRGIAAVETFDNAFSVTTIPIEANRRIRIQQSSFRWHSADFMGCKLDADGMAALNIVAFKK